MDLIERLKKKKILNEDDSFNRNKEERSQGIKQNVDYSERQAISRYNGDIQTGNSNVRHVGTEELNRDFFNKVQRSRINPVGTVWDVVKSLANDLYNPSSNKEITSNKAQSFSNFQRVVNAKNENKQKFLNVVQQRKQEEINKLQKQLKDLEKQEEKLKIKDSPKLLENDANRYNMPVVNESRVDFGLSSEEEIKQAKKMTADKLYELTNGNIDERGQFNKSLTTVGATIGNVGLGALESVNNTKRLVEKSGQVATKKLISSALQSKGVKKENANDIGSILGAEGVKQFENKVLNMSTAKQNDELLDNAIQRNVFKAGEGGKALAQMGTQLGSNGVNMLLGAFNPFAGATMTFSSAGGSYVRDAGQRGMTDEQQLMYALPMAMAEAGTEYVGLKNISKAGKGLKALVKGGKSISKELAQDTTKKVLKDYGISIADNMIQEAIIDPIQELTAGVVGGKDKADWNNMAQRMLEDGLNGGLFAMITGGASLGIQSCVGVLEKVNTGVEITNKELINAVKDSSKRSNPKDVILSYMKDSLLEQKSKIQENLGQEQNNINNQQINQVESNVAENGNVEQIKSNYIESAKRYNIDTNNSTVKGMYEIANKRGINILFDDTVFKSSKQNAKWLVDNERNRTVVINPNADTNTALQSVMVHELTHDLEGTNEYNKINKMVLDKLKQADNYNDMMFDIANTYKDEYSNMSKEDFSKIIEQEAVADYLGENLGNQEFVNELVRTQNRNTIEKIIDWVKNKITSLKNTVTGNQEANYWNKIKENFEKAYNKEYQGNNIAERFSIQTDSKGNKFVRVDTDQDIFEGKTIAEQTKIAKKYILENFREKGVIKDDKTINVSRRTANEYTHPKHALPFVTKQSKMKASTELNNLLNVSEYQYSTNDDGRHAFAKDGWDYYKTKFQVGENSYTGLLNIAKDGSKSMLYDITNIKRVSQNYSTSNKSFSVSLTNSNNSILPTKEDVNSDTTKYSMQESENNSDSFSLSENLKQKQLDIINDLNPMQDDYHTGIRNVEDIKTLQETMEDSDWSGYDEYNPDLTKDMIENAIKTGKITVYSSYPIKNGVFISPSYMEAESYSENGKVYSKEVNINDVAWIDPTQGQYAKIDESKFSKQSNGTWQQFLKDTSINKGTRESIQDVRVPISKENLNKVNIANNQQTLYNNTESEGGINGGEEIRQSNRDVFEQFINETNTESQKTTRAREDFEKRFREATRKRIIDNKLSENSKKNRKILKDVYDVDIFFIENNPEFSGGADKKIKLINLTQEIANSTNNNVVTGHELFEVIRNTREDIKNEYIEPLIDVVKDDNNFNEVLKIYIDNCETKDKQLLLDNPRYIAKEILFDEAGFMFNEDEFKLGVNKQKTDLTRFSDYLNTSKSILQMGLSNIEQKARKSDITLINEKTGNPKIPIKEKSTEEKVAQILEKNPEQVKKSDRKWAILKANILDKGIVFEEISRKTNNRDLQGKWDYTLTSTARGQNAIGNARFEFDSKTKTQKQVCKSLEDIKIEVGNNSSDFSKYMYHLLNIDRMSLEDRFGGDTGINYERKNVVKNKPVFGEGVTAEISKDYVHKLEQKYPEFKEYAQDVYDFLDANTKELVNNGVISEETRQLFKEMYPHYVPIKRVDKKGNAIKVPLDTNRTGINSPIAKATGGNKDILPLFETIADRTLQTYRASARNSFGVELKNTLQQLNEYQENNNEISDVDSIVEEISNQDVNNGLLQEGTDGSNPTFTVFDNGQKVTFDINKDMYDALKPVNDSSILSKTFKPLNKLSNFHRGVLTEYNPMFLITNSIKDAQDVLINSQHATKTYSKFPEAYYQIVKKGYWYNEYIQNGGEQNSYFKDGEFESSKKVPISKKILRVPLDAISNINNVIEMAPRLAEYIASREKGTSIETSMLDASRVTTNFKAGGDLTKFANRNGATFFNASVQGAMQTVRNIQEANAKGLKGWSVLMCKTAIAGVPAIVLNNLVWKDDEDYDELQDYVKDDYYCIAKFGDGRFVRIPKGRSFATIQKIVSNVNEYFTDDKKLNIDNLSKDFWEDLNFAIEHLAPNNPIDNNIISPMVQTATNTSWYGEDIVPSRLQDKPKAEQYDETTDSFSKWLGQKLNVSPYKVNYLLNQYSGGVGDVLLPLATKQAENNVFEDKFTTDSIMKSKYPSEFFEKIDEYKVKANSSKASNEDVVKYKYLSRISDDMSDLYKQKREIQNSDMSDKEKKEKLKEVQKEINVLAKNGLENSKNVSIKSDTAKIDDIEYYKALDVKTGNKEWKRLSDEEKEKNKDISLISYADYKNKTYSLMKQKKDCGELKENEQLKNKDKIGVLLNSNYTEKEKEAIYKNYIGTEDKKIQLVDKLGLPLNEYFKYKQQDFKNDKDEEGETVSGTKKQKVYNYLNSIPDNKLSMDYKKIICKLENINDYNSDIVNFVNNSKNLTANNRKELLKIIGFKVDKYGNVTNTMILPITKSVK